MILNGFMWSGAVDGGREYLWRLVNEKDFEELSHFIQLVEITIGGFEIVWDALSKKDISFINIRFYLCGSDNTSFQKGDGIVLVWHEWF